jgi:hypothetical protein
MFCDHKKTLRSRTTDADIMLGKVLNVLAPYNDPENYDTLFLSLNIILNQKNCNRPLLWVQHPQSPRSDLPYSGPRLSPDCPFPDPIGARIDLRFKTSPNLPCFCKRTKYIVYVNAFCGPILVQTGNLIDPGKSCQKNAPGCRLKAIIWGPI